MLRCSGKTSSICVLNYSMSQWIDDDMFGERDTLEHRTTFDFSCSTRHERRYLLIRKGKGSRQAQNAIFACNADKSDHCSAQPL